MKKFFIIYIFLAVGFLVLFPFLNYVSAIQIPNPLEYKTLGELIEAIIRFLRNLALVVAPLVIIIAAYFFLMSGGNPEKVTQAKNMILYALIGLAIILMAEGIIHLIRTVILAPQPPPPQPL